LQHWAAILSGFNYRPEHRKSNVLSVADALSRLPTNANALDLSFNSISDELPVSVKAVKDATLADPVLSRVLEFTVEGWPNKLIDPALTLYYKLRLSFSIEKGLLLFANRVVVPLALLGCRPMNPSFPPKSFGCCLKWTSPFH